MFRYLVLVAFLGFFVCWVNCEVTISTTGSVDDGNGTMTISVGGSDSPIVQSKEIPPSDCHVPDLDSPAYASSLPTLPRDDPGNNFVNIVFLASFIVLVCIFLFYKIKLDKEKKQ